MGANTQDQRKFRPAKVFKDAVEPASSPRSPGSRPPALNKQITAICFDDRGDQLITAGEDDVFHLYNCKTGKRVPLA
jgi:COMPASS component SWD2